MLWGYANGWFPEYLTADEDPLYARLKFLLKYGFKEMPISLKDILVMEEPQRDKLGEFLNVHDLHLTPQIWYDYVGASAEEARYREEEIIKGLRQHTHLLRNWSVFTMASAGHRFDHDLPLEEKLQRLSARLRPISAACHELGTPLGINNRGDFYISDFVSLCQQTPELRLHIDTANIFWAGEPIFPAFELAAPLTIGTHWRDEICVPGNRKPRGLLLQNCVTGDGDVPLHQCLEVLREKAAGPDRLVMELELFPGSGSDRVQAIERAIAFLRTLPGVEL
ncbi:sugar phosphate isomerase/epimerase family protein [Candidatus Poribacteria bacterium]